ncbi:adrenodoxin-like protein 2, mitochondrial [Stomoxys calcitrans]|uniref:2Fe-2S ferredoxin-type domain-containing protein n=1 Tax=Stomoxys calcitrans TaxID=35570 RepID=A0A1I8NS82_STOCA|nr:adrenodoxin-like protein 2, mitochondrial [Stomoxys calcitrans]
MALRNVLKCTNSLIRRQLMVTSKSQINEQTRNFTLGATLKQDVKITFIRASGERIQTKGKVGDSLLDVVVNNDIDLDGFGACEGTLTCSTCHLIFKPADYNKLPDKPSDEELDMLDLAYDLTDTSRLGCQITLTKDMDGLEVHVPATINDARAA